MAFAPKPGCPMCGIVSAAASSAPGTPGSPSNSPKQHEILWRDENFTIYEGLLRTLYKDPKKAKYKKLGEFLGSDMKGWRYVPLFEYFTEEVNAIAVHTLTILRRLSNTYICSSKTKPSAL